MNHVAAHGVGAALSASLSGLVVVRAGYSDRELSAGMQSGTPQRGPFGIDDERLDERTSAQPQ